MARRSASTAPRTWPTRSVRSPARPCRTSGLRTCGVSTPRPRRSPSRTTGFGPLWLTWTRSRRTRPSSSTGAEGENMEDLTLRDIVRVLQQSDTRIRDMEQEIAQAHRLLDRIGVEGEDEAGDPIE